jgi:hypothetical protein
MPNRQIKETSAMLWLFAIIGVAGLVLGSMFRAPFLLAASFVVCGIGVSVGLAQGRSFNNASRLVLELLVVLQVFYLAGVWIAAYTNKNK